MCQGNRIWEIYGLRTYVKGCVSRECCKTLSSVDLLRRPHSLPPGPESQSHIHFPTTIIMTSLPKALLKAALFATTASATNLFVACTNGNLTTLSLTGTGNTSNLAISSWTNECASNPAALNLDSQNRILYCMDRASSSSVNGSMNSFDVDTNGNLTRLARIPVPASGVWAGFFGAEGGNKGLATVH